MRGALPMDIFADITAFVGTTDERPLADLVHYESALARMDNWDVLLS